MSLFTHSAASLMRRQSKAQTIPGKRPTAPFIGTLVTFTTNIGTYLSRH